jgi:hypothetical protein
MMGLRRASRRPTEVVGSELVMKEQYRGTAWCQTGVNRDYLDSRQALVAATTAFAAVW